MTTAFRKLANAHPEGGARQLLEVFDASGGKATVAADRLGMTRRQFDREVRRLDRVLAEHPEFNDLLGRIRRMRRAALIEACRVDRPPVRPVTADDLEVPEELFDPVE